MDLVDHCTREEANTEWKFYKHTNNMGFASLLKDVPIGCIDTVFPKPAPKSHNVNSSTYETNLTQPYNDSSCLFTAIAPHLHSNNNLPGEPAKCFDFFLARSEETYASKVHDVQMNDNPNFEDILQLTIFCRILISLMENSLVNLLVEVFRNMSKVSNF